MSLDVNRKKEVAETASLALFVSFSCYLFLSFCLDSNLRWWCETPNRRVRLRIFVVGRYLPITSKTDKLQNVPGSVYNSKIFNLISVLELLPWDMVRMSSRSFENGGILLVLLAHLIYLILPILSESVIK